MEKFICITRDYLTSEPTRQFESETFISEDSEEAWSYVEENLATNNSMEWLMSFAEARALHEKLSKVLKEENETITEAEIAEYEDERREDE